MGKILNVLLQTGNNFFSGASANWQTYVILGGLIVFVFILLLISNRSSKKTKKYNRWNFRREALRIGLTKTQSRLLESYVHSYQIHRPFALLSNTRELNMTLRKAFKDIQYMEASEQTKEERKFQLFRIKQHIDRTSKETGLLHRTRQFRLGQNVTLQQANGNRFTSVITANLKEFYCAQIPINPGKIQLNWRKGTHIRLFVWSIAGEEIAFESKILGHNSIKGIASFILQHANRIEHSIQRRHRRRKIKIPCSFRPVGIVEKNTGRKATKRVIVLGNQKKSGTLLDISSAGCSLAVTSRDSFQGEWLKLAFKSLHGSPVSTLGKVVSSRRISQNRKVLHVMFTRCSIKNLNLINEYVYNME